MTEQEPNDFLISGMRRTTSERVALSTVAAAVFAGLSARYADVLANSTKGFEGAFLLIAFLGSLLIIAVPAALAMVFPGGAELRQPLRRLVDRSLPLITLISLYLLFQFILHRY